MVNVAASVSDPNEEESRQPSLSESMLLSDAALNFISSQKKKHVKQSSLGETGSSGQRQRDTNGSPPSADQEQREAGNPFASVTQIPAINPLKKSKEPHIYPKEPSTGKSSGQHFIKNTLLKKF